MDGKHVQIECPKNSGSLHFNYKKTFSNVLLAVCNAKYEFTIVDIGSYGSQSDGGIFGSCQFGKQLQSNELNIPPSRPLPGKDNPIPFCFVGDEAFPLRHNLMRPYAGRRGGLTVDENIFNYRFSRARRTIENTFGILVARWRIFLTPIKTTVDKVDDIIKCAVVLHNYLKITNNQQYCYSNFSDNENGLGEWRSEVDLDNSALGPCRRLGSNNRSYSAALVRNYFKDYFCSSGSLPWQLEHVQRGA